MQRSAVGDYTQQVVVCDGRDNINVRSTPTIAYVEIRWLFVGQHILSTAVYRLVANGCPRSVAVGMRPMAQVHEPRRHARQGHN